MSCSLVSPPPGHLLSPGSATHEPLVSLAVFPILDWNKGRGAMEMLKYLPWAETQGHGVGNPLGLFLDVL